MPSYLRSEMLAVMSALALFCNCNGSQDSDGSQLSQEKRDSLIRYSEKLRLEGTKIRDYEARFLEASSLHGQALEAALKADDKISIASCYHQLSTDCQRVGREDEALRYAFNAVSYCEMVPDTTTDEYLRMYAMALTSLSNVQINVGDFDGAEANALHSLSIEKKRSNQYGLATNYRALSDVWSGRGRLDSARVYCNKAMNCYQEAGSARGVSVLYSYIGRFAEKEGHLREALGYYKDSYNKAEDVQDHRHQLETEIAIGRVHLALNDLDSAKVYIARSIERSEKMRFFSYMSTSNMLMSRLLERQGKSAEAFSYLKVSASQRDSIDPVENQQRLRQILLEFEQNRNEQKVNNVRASYEAARQTQTTIIWTSLIVAFVLLISVLLLVYVQRLRRHRMLLLQQVSDAQTAYFKDIAQEVLEPLTIVSGTANSLLIEDYGERGRITRLNTIKQQCGRLSDLTNQMLGLSLLMTGESNEVKWRHGDISAYLRLGLASYRDYARLHNISLIVDSSSDSIEMDFVPAYFDVILRNLFKNAFQYTEGGGQVGVQFLATNDNKLQFIMTNSGETWTDEQLKHVFDLFQHNMDAKDKHGLGLGLAYVRKVVETMHGTIKPANLPGNIGIQFVIEIPLVARKVKGTIEPWSLMDSEMTRLEPKELADPVVESTPEEAEGENSNLPIILVAEDNPDITEYVKLLLRPHYRVITAADGYEAIKKAEMHQPDLLMTDIMMPGISGFELCRLFKQSETLGDVPIIIVSACTTEEDRIKGVEAGASAYMTKPFNPDELVLRINKLLEQRRQQRQQVQRSIDAMNSASPDHKTPADLEYLARFVRIINQNMEKGELNIEHLAEQMATSKTQLFRRVKELTGVAPAAYILQVRMERARRILSTTQQSIGEVSMQCGFEDLSYFSRVFKQMFGLSPSQYRKTPIDLKERHS